VTPALPEPVRPVPGLPLRVGLPDGLTRFDFAAVGSAEGNAWMAALPALVAGLADDWDLAQGEVIRHGFHAVVVAARQSNRPVALKVAWPPEQVVTEARALAAWRGRGAVELLASDLPRGALLLEHLSESRSLASLPLTEAAAQAGTLLRTLAIEAPASVPSLQAIAVELAATFAGRQRALGEPVPSAWLTLAGQLADALALDTERLLVHTDLHYGNVLATDRPDQQWVAIDPRPAAGAPERSTAELLWTRADELSGPPAIVGLLERVVEHGRLTLGKAVAWSFVRSIDYWLWGLENGLTIDPVRCQRIASALEPLASRLSLP